MRFNRYEEELQDRLTASLLDTWVVKDKVVEALLDGYATWTSQTGNYQTFHTVHHRMLHRIIGAWFRSQDHQTLSYDLALQLSGFEV